MKTATPDPTKFALIRGDDWEALYVNGVSVSQEHRHEPITLLELAEQHGFAYSTLAVLWASEADCERAAESGNFPRFLSEFESCDP